MQRYLLDDFAASLNAFLVAIDVPRATMCGHSLGGAIAVHFGYHYPQRLERLVLVSTGGLGREVHPVLRAAAIPGAPRLLNVALRPRLARLYRRRGLHRRLPSGVEQLRTAERLEPEEREHHRGELVVREERHGREHRAERDRRDGERAEVQDDRLRPVTETANCDPAGGAR